MHHEPVEQHNRPESLWQNYLILLGGVKPSEGWAQVEAHHHLYARRELAPQLPFGEMVECLPLSVFVHYCPH